MSLCSFANMARAHFLTYSSLQHILISHFFCFSWKQGTVRPLCSSMALLPLSPSFHPLPLPLLVHLLVSNGCLSSPLFCHSWYLSSSLRSILPISFKSRELPSLLSYHEAGFLPPRFRISRRSLACKPKQRRDLPQGRRNRCGWS